MQHRDVCIIIYIASYMYLTTDHENEFAASFSVF